MARQNYWESDFITGEVSPRLFGRVDLQKYASGVQTLSNFIVQLTGGVYRRSGTIYANGIKTQSDKSLLIPFIVSPTEAYVIEMGNNYFRFYTNHGVLEDMGTPVEVATPYATADLPLIDFAQSADVLFLVHPSYPPQMLSRTSATTFVLAPFVFQDGPYMTENQVEGSLLQHSGFTQYLFTDPVSMQTYYNYNGSGTVTASGFEADGTTPFAPFVSTDVGRWIRILQGSFWGAVLITSVTSSTVVQGTVFNPIALGDSGNAAVTYGSVTYAPGTIYPTWTWRMGSWSNTSGWPSAIVFHQGRLCFANTPTEPTSVWLSESGIFNLFSPTENDVTVEDSDGIGYTIAANQLNEVQWMLSGQALMVGTYGSEFAVLASSNSTPLTPSNTAFIQQTAFGSKKIKPYLIGVSTLYVQRSGQKLREQTYDWSINGWRSIEISMLSEHLFREGGGITQATYQQEPNNIWWGCRADGVLVGMTYVKEQSILGFHRHTIGGTFAGGPAVVESVCAIPTPDGAQDQLWMIVKRTIDGATARYVEYMDVPFDSSVAGKNTMNFVDAGLQTAGFPVPLGSPITTVTGLTHLVGQTVAICADGSVLPNQVVADDGTVTLPVPASLVTTGLPYISQLKTLTLPVPGDTGTGQGAVKRIDRLIFRLLDTLTFKYGPNFDTVEDVLFANTATPMDDSPPLFSGDKPVSMPSSYDKYAYICIECDKPYPCNLTGMAPQMVVQPK